jgi:diguanylate cyclase (GGDEF)-like protein
MVCSSGVDSESALGERIRVGDGAGGRAISEDRLVVLHDYADNPAALQSFAAVGLQAAMAAPVHEDGAVVGSLVVASHRPGRRYSPVEQDMLLSFADHASLAVTDARMVSTLRKALDDARHDAMHDVLTGLPNRALLRDRLTQAWARAHRRNSLVAVLFLDLDGFKHVNDSLGHDVGDQLLMAVGARLGIRLRDADTVARMGGDEFAVIIEDVDAIDQVEEVAERLLEMLADPIVVDNREVAVNASIGIAVAAGDETDGRALLRNADLAMYEAKRSGGARFVVYRAEMHRTTVERLDLEQALRRALTTDELLLHYQPIHDIASGRIVSVEALVRWRHPVRGVISPAEFIPIAESSRLIGPLGEWVLREACAQAARWPADIQVAVNVSPLQIDSCLVPTVRRILAETGLSPHRLKLEVTEGTAMADVPETMEVIADLHREGIHFAIDDFGTGHSSLARLRRLPIDQLKIDRSFVEDLADPGGAVLVSAIIALARGAGLVAVAEGVETDAQLQQLRELGCDQAQGFLFARPADAAVVTQLILASERARLQPAVPAPLPLPLPLPLPRTKPATIPR